MDGNKRTKDRRYEFPRELGCWQKLSCVGAGMGNMDRKLLEDKMVVPLLVPSEDDEAALKRSEAGRIRGIRAEVRKLARSAPILGKALSEAEGKVAALASERLAIERAEPLSFGSVATKAPVALLVLFEGGFTFMTLADAWGFDVSQGLEEMPASIGLLIGGASLFIVFLTAQFGAAATSPASPVRRALGRVGLVLAAVCLAKLRIDSVADGGVALGILGAAGTIAAGLFAGRLQRRLIPIFRSHREHRRKLAVAAKSAAEAEEQIAIAKATIESAEARRKMLLSGAQALAQKAQERAARRTEVGLIQAARLKAVRWYFEVGQRWAGKGSRGHE